MIQKVAGPEDQLEYWRRRAQSMGRRAVLDQRHTDDEVDSITKMQQRELFPWFRAQLNGSEKCIVDFGCGAGRHTTQLAEITGGNVIGVDPTRTLIELAPKSQPVSYQVIDDSKIPLDTSSVDAIWCCSVLCCILGRDLIKVTSEFDRILHPSGLLFLVENTTEQPDSKNVSYRSVGDYTRMFPNFCLAHLHDYYDFEERMSVMAGRKGEADTEGS